ncbi:hypothetical protein [Furfurilactobacillus siliginis]|uniref:Uncharacterized protein n=1 Tax=Furfurilactobacillus siliginis TaxID=348151 RepID=A0A510VU25_9LACO|nr:hypothetical protein [Furfurilactobacillus siliginis]GEK28465.1 hypothetical protein LSI01_07760 [Furfurilactobacillus siliginis]
MSKVGLDVIMKLWSAENEFKFFFGVTSVKKELPRIVDHIRLERIVYGKQ